MFFASIHCSVNIYLKLYCFVLNFFLGTTDLKTCSIQTKLKSFDLIWSRQCYISSQIDQGSVRHSGSRIRWSQACLLFFENLWIKQHSQLSDPSKFHRFMFRDNAKNGLSVWTNNSKNHGSQPVIIYWKSELVTGYITSYSCLFILNKILMFSY